MRRALLLAALLALSPVPGSLGAVCEGPREQAVPSRAHGKDTDSYQLPPSLLRRLYDSSVSLEGLLRVLSRASVGPKASSLAQKRDMHDFFVGLMGKRNTQAATPVDGNQEEAPNFGTIKYPPDVE
ncbi:tachykinin-3 [Sorex araneus]|uniref:tachykinin-3 n=1 Tax=Sorex araneus TaxID=42254 RepID=UPI00064B076D|nr:tachykinin-3 [Sorex araneus]XP_054984617.1 tachykinin-3 [Sorex araneus]XP_054984618.1 tachykinin-3 [Sorex araneus]